MKIFWSIFLVVFTLLSSLFLFQNQTRTLSNDTNGYQLSFDLGVWGLATTELNFPVLIGTTFVVGIALGLLFPVMMKDLLNRS